MILLDLALCRWLPLLSSHFSYGSFLAGSRINLHLIAYRKVSILLVWSGKMVPYGDKMAILFPPLLRIKFPKARIALRV